MGIGVLELVTLLQKSNTNATASSVRAEIDYSLSRYSEALCLQKPRSIRKLRLNSYLFVALVPAARLGIKRPTLQFRMRKLGISRPRRP